MTQLEKLQTMNPFMEAFEMARCICPSDEGMIDDECDFMKDPERCEWNFKDKIACVRCWCKEYKERENV